MACVWPQRDTSGCHADSGAPIFTPSASGHGGILRAVNHGGPACPATEDETATRAGVAANWINRVIHS